MLTNAGLVQVLQRDVGCHHTSCRQKSRRRRCTLFHSQGSEHALQVSGITTELATVPVVHALPSEMHVGHAIVERALTLDLRDPLQLLLNGINDGDEYAVADIYELVFQFKKTDRFGPNITDISTFTCMHRMRA